MLPRLLPTSNPLEMKSSPTHIKIRDSCKIVQNLKNLFESVNLILIIAAVTKIRT